MKILFLEDRPSRQKQFLPKREKDVEALHSIQGVLMPESNECKEIIAKINQVNYVFDNDLKLIIVHKSALATSGLEYINKFCKAKKVKFVCFSGGISQLTYNNENYEFINLNSTDFYTERLIPFLENVIDDKSETLLELINKDWKLSYLFLARQIIGSLELEKDEDAKFDFQERLDSFSKQLKLNFSLNLQNIGKIDTEINKRILQL